MLLRAGLGVLLVAVLLQLLPFGRLGADPPVTRDAPWPNGRARELAVAACYDCHSNQTRRPLYSRVAPFSWLVARDVRQGREKLNFSAWEGEGGDARDAADTIVEGSMPPRRYLLLHPDADLTDAERRLLVEALEGMGGGDRSGPGGG
ncbi:MAG TPA: heme-binding domain-containing protein [Actinomycetota bacterium]|nr:heme-binding domain-containing protein [Actinomycetota bacterium]